MHPRSVGAVTHFLSATFEPTGDYPSVLTRWQIARHQSARHPERSEGSHPYTPINEQLMRDRSRCGRSLVVFATWDDGVLFLKARGELFALFRQLVGHDAAER